MPTIPSFGNEMADIGASIKAIFLSMLNALGTAFGAVGHGIANTFNAVAQAISHGFTVFFETLGNGFHTVFAACGHAFTAMFAALSHAFTTIFGSIGSALAAFFHGLGYFLLYVCVGIAVVGGLSLLFTTLALAIRSRKSSRRRYSMSEGNRFLAQDHLYQIQPNTRGHPVFAEERTRLVEEYHETETSNYGTTTVRHFKRVVDQVCRVAQPGVAFEKNFQQLV